MSQILLLDPEKEQHLAALLLLVLPAKSLTVNVVADVADFPDYTIIFP
jgi:hypothetical protein